MTAIIVTGAASGIGRACAERLLADGHQVAAFDLDEFELNAGKKAFTTVVDVRDSRAVARATDQARERFGQITGLVAAAGVERDARVTELAEADWDLVLDTNLKGTFLCARAVVPHLRAAGGGAIITFGSVLGRAALPGVTAYGASKAGIEALTRAIALDHAREGVRAVCVAPGTTDTPLTWQTVPAEALDQVKREAAEDVPLGFIASPDHIAQAVVFLLSDAAAFITGTSLVVDGGLLARIAASH